MLVQKKRVYLFCFEDRKDETYEYLCLEKNKLLLKCYLPVKMSRYVGIQFRSSFQVNRGGGLPPRNLYKSNGRF